MVYSLYKEAKEDYAKYITGMQMFKTYLVDACKSKIMRGMTTHLIPITAMTIQYIFNELEVQYGTPTAHNIQRLQMQAQIPCESEEEFTAYEHDLSVAFERLDEQRAAYSEVQKMQIIIEGTAHLTNIRDIINRYITEVPKIAERNHEDMLERVRVALPNFITTSTVKAHAASIQPPAIKPPLTA